MTRLSRIPRIPRLLAAATLGFAAAGAAVVVGAAPAMPPIVQAASRGDAPGVEALLAKGADANAASSDGGTALMAAARLGRYDIVRHLLVHGAHRDQRDRQGRTAFDFAVERQDTDSIALLRDAS